MIPGPFGVFDMCGSISSTIRAMAVDEASAECLLAAFRTAGSVQREIRLQVFDACLGRGIPPRRQGVDDLVAPTPWRPHPTAS